MECKKNQQNETKNAAVILARNAIDVNNTAFDLEQPHTWNLDQGVLAYKLDVQVLLENAKQEVVYGPVMIQVTEDPQHVYEDEYTTSQILRPGFSSRVYVRPITGFRVRKPTPEEVITFGLGKELPGKIDFTLYG